MVFAFYSPGIIHFVVGPRPDDLSPLAPSLAAIIALVLPQDYRAVRPDARISLAGRLKARYSPV